MPTIGILFYYFSNATNVPLNRALLFLFFTFDDFVSFFLHCQEMINKSLIYNVWVAEVFEIYLLLI